MTNVEDREGEVCIHSPLIVCHFNVTHQTPLHKAALNGHLPVIQYLVGAGGDPLCHDHDGWTPLHNACSKACPNPCKSFGFTNVCARVIWTL